jgi:hypothetical protein
MHGANAPPGQPDVAAGEGGGDDGGNVGGGVGSHLVGDGVGGMGDWVGAPVAGVQPMQLLHDSQANAYAAEYLLKWVTVSGKL